MNELKNGTTGLADYVLGVTAKMMLAVGNSSVYRSGAPFWWNEPKMPKSMLDDIEEKEHA